MRLKGGSDDGVFGFFATVDSAGELVCGKSLWGFVKNVIGLGKDKEGIDKDKTPEEDLAELQLEKQAGKEMAIRKSSSVGIVDKKMMYFLDQGLLYALSPLTHFLRYVRGTEK
jgi:hypothetical protein